MMAGIYIPKMAMPGFCGECPFIVREPREAPWCGRANYTICDGFVDPNGKPEWCDLIYVPDHGRLIDADKLRKHEFIHDGDAYAVVMSRHIRQAPTIIPADPADKEETK